MDTQQITTTMTFNNIGSKLRVVNGAPVPRDTDLGLISVTAACRIVGVSQHGPAKTQMKKLGIPIVGLGGKHGGIYLVRESDVMRVKAKREAEAETKAKAKAKPESSPKSAAVVPFNAAQNEQLTADLVELHQRMDRIEVKLDKLLAIWGVEAA